ncbi:MAG: glycosyltransferase family 2 protein [Chloroflexi bacterium]|nr:glycosyltransferase family 2 protein [Chloroflexota bacterium]
MTAMSAGSVVVVIFSKDRPLQLDATLRSFALHCPDRSMSTIRALFTTSTPRFAAGYRVLAAAYPDVEFVQEAQFKPDLLRVVEGSAYVLFLVDDTLFVGPASLGTAVAVLEKDASCLGFSYRLGRNTTYCYTLDKPQRLPAFEELGSGVLGFDWTQAESDFGYPLELSSSLYGTADVLPLLQSLEYRNPNTLEAALAQRAASFRATRPRLANYEQSAAFSIPANMVQTAWANRIDGNPAMTAEALADAFDRGERLDVEHYRGFVPNACHQELEFVFTKDQTIPTVSIVIPCYNQAQYLPDAVHSVVAQTFTDWEIVIVDDGSPDATAEVARRLAGEVGSRLRIVSQPNGGLAAARNAGVAAARGRYILPLDADDMLEPKMLARTVDMLEREPGIAIVYTDLRQFGRGAAVVRAEEFSASRLLEANHLSYCSLYRREIWEAVGGYNPNMRHGYEDWDFWIGAAERGYVARRIPQALFRYRVRANGMYANALRHDFELRTQIRANHPASYPVENPAVSVIVPAHNYGHFLRETIQSVREQTFASWECIVIDDGSSDDTPQVLDDLAKQDRRIRCYSQERQGLSATRNRGISLSRGRYIQFLDADDLLDRAKLERQVERLDGSADVDIVFGPTKYFDDGDMGNLRDSLLPGGQPLLDLPIPSQRELVERLVARNIMTVAAPLVRSSVFDRVGRFDITLPSLEDWDLWLRCALAGVRFEYMQADEATALIRVHGVSMSANRGRMRAAEARLRHRISRQLPATLRQANRRWLRNAARAGAVETAFSGASLRALQIAVAGAFASHDPRLLLLTVPIALTLVPGGTRVVTAVRARRRRGRRT